MTIFSNFFNEDPHRPYTIFETHSLSYKMSYGPKSHHASKKSYGLNMLVAPEAQFWHNCYHGKSIFSEGRPPTHGVSVILAPRATTLHSQLG